MNDEDRRISEDALTLSDLREREQTESGGSDDTESSF